MEMERSIPKSINYQDVLPVAVPAVARRRRYYPQNGTNFNFVGTREIRIEVGSTNALLDPQHSYLEFFINNTVAQTVGLDIGGGHIFFDEVSVEQGGRVLCKQQAHNRLHAGILSSAQMSLDGQATESLTQGQRAYNGVAGGAAGQIAPAAGIQARDGGVAALSKHSDNTQIAAGAFARFTMAMPTGLFTQDKLLPLPLVSQSNPITLVFRMANSQDVGAWNIAPLFGAIEIVRANYVAQMIEVGGDVIGQLRMMQEMGGGQLTISGQDIEHSSDLIPAGSAGEIPIRIPGRKRSIKSLLFQINSEDFTNGGGLNVAHFYNLSFGGNANMNSYQLKVGSVVYPPTPIQCWGNCARAGAALVNRPRPEQERGECAMELAKALGTLGFNKPTGRLSNLTYGTNTVFAVGAGSPNLSDGDNGDGANSLTPAGNTETCVCPFGLDLESFQQTAIESGIDSETMAMETTLLCNIDDITSGAEDKNVHCYIIYDQHYYFNADGSVTFSN